MMKLEQIKEVASQLKVGDKIIALIPNGSCRLGSASCYRRKGIFNGMKKTSGGYDGISFLVGSNKKEFFASFYPEYDRKIYRTTGEKVPTGYGEYIFGLTLVERA